MWPFEWGKEFGQLRHFGKALFSTNPPGGIAKQYALTENAT